MTKHFSPMAKGGAPSNTRPQAKAALTITSKDMKRRHALDYDPKLPRGVNRRIGRSGR